MGRTLGRKGHRKTQKLGEIRGYTRRVRSEKHSARQVGTLGKKISIFEEFKKKIAGLKRGKVIKSRNEEKNPSLGM